MPTGGPFYARGPRSRDRLRAPFVSYGSERQARRTRETEVSASRFVHVYLRDDLGPVGTDATMLHELQHVADHDLIRAGRVTVDEPERRAEAAFTVWAPLDGPEHRALPNPYPMLAALQSP